jgi:L-aminopeptidase/D-esterase-like protein
MNHGITDVPGFEVGHREDRRGATGCTVLLCPPGTVGGMDIRGSAAGTRQTDSLQSFHFVDEVHAILLSGGSAFGLDATGGVMKYLEERGIGYSTSAGKVPIVPTAIIYDLAIGEGRIRPDSQMGYEACVNRRSGKIEEGSVGVGTGATVGKLLGIPYATKGGVGTHSVGRSSGLIVGALVVVNAFGDVVDPGAGGKILAGARDPHNPGRFIDSAQSMKGGIPAGSRREAFQHTTLGVVATNARLTKRQAIKVAQMAHVGLARTISPVHSTVDGDLIFALSAGHESADVNSIGLMAEEAVAMAVIRAIKAADGLGILPAYQDLHKSG